MRLYLVAGERALALRQFEMCRTTLRERLGVEPSAATRELHLQAVKGEEPRASGEGRL
jgi:DNA-binding SARP family transcriptional activator